MDLSIDYRLKFTNLSVLCNTLQAYRFDIKCNKAFDITAEYSRKMQKLPTFVRIYEKNSFDLV